MEKKMKAAILLVLILFGGCSNQGGNNLIHEVEEEIEHDIGPKAEEYGPFPT